MTAPVPQSQVGAGRLLAHDAVILGGSVSIMLAAGQVHPGSKLNL